MTKAVIFDFDGIIVDTEPLHYRAYQEIFVPLGLGFPWEEYVSRYIGFDDREIFSRVFAAGDHVPGLEEIRLLVAEKAAIFQKIALSEIQPYPGVAELIGRLYPIIPLALCSGAVRTDVIPILKRLGLFDSFDAVVTADDVAASKPDPESYMLAVRKLSLAHPNRGIRPWNCIAIEDTPTGIASAKAAGIPVLAVTNSHSAERLFDAGLIVDSLERVTPGVLETGFHGRGKQGFSASPS